MSRQHQTSRREDRARGPERPRWLFLVAGGLIYAGALLGMWIVLAGQPDAQDLVAGSVAAVLSVGAGYLFSQRGKLVPSVRLADLRTLAVLPWQVVAETGQVFALAARKAAGRPVTPRVLCTVPLDTGPAARAVAPRAQDGGAGPRHGSGPGAGASAGRRPGVRCRSGGRRRGGLMSEL